MDLADNKGIWLKDIMESEIPSAELTLWIAYYKIKHRESKDADRKRRGIVSGDKYGSVKGTMSKAKG